MMLKETGAGVGRETFKNNLSKDREDEKVLDKLRKEFTKLDMDNNG